MSHADLLQETHWCPYCDEPPALKPVRIEVGRWGPTSIDLVVECPKHGEHLHDPHDTDCWCLK